MNEEELRQAFEEMEKENKALRFRCVDKEAYVVADIDGTWQRAIRMSEEQAKA